MKGKKRQIITELKEVDRTTKEGRLLFAALAKITTESKTGMFTVATNISVNETFKINNKTKRKMK